MQSSTVYVFSGMVIGGFLRCDFAPCLRCLLRVCSLFWSLVAQFFLTFCRLEYGEYAQERLAAGLTFDDDFYFRVLLPLVVLDGPPSFRFRSACVFVCVFLMFARLPGQPG